MTTDAMLLVVAGMIVLRSFLAGFIETTSTVELWFWLVASIPFVFIGGYFFWLYFSKAGRDYQNRIQDIKSLPGTITNSSETSVRMGTECDLGIPLFLSDSIRSRHVHILGATGSGKTESVILNFLNQDVKRGHGSIILDAKGDISFLRTLRSWNLKQDLRVFDLSSAESLTYDPIATGSPLEAAQRLFASLTWSEEYYKSKAFSTLQRLFQTYFERQNRNPTLSILSHLLSDKDQFVAYLQSDQYSAKVAAQDFQELSGLRDQIKTLCMGHLATILSPDKTDITLEDVANGGVIYFRLQSLLSSQLVSTMGKLVINHLNYLAGIAHRTGAGPLGKKLIPTYLDEFATFACPEFADLISKARSANLALHFSHQSVGDLKEISEGFLNRLTDNSATKIIFRINDPDSAEFFARSFGTQLYQKITQRITNVKTIDTAEVVGEGTQREAHQFRASPDLFKTLPTGVASVLVAHGEDTPHGASSVLKIRFPKLKEEPSI